MNVLFCTDGKRGRRGGVANYTQLLFAHFDRQTVVPYDWNLWTGYKMAPLSQHRLSISLYRKYKIAQVLITLPWLVRRGAIDLVHLNPSLVPRAIQRDTAFARRCLNIGIPFVVFFRGWDKNYENRINSNPKLMKKLAASLGGASVIIVLASEFRNRLVEWGFDKEKIVLETTAVDDNLLTSRNIIEHRKRSITKAKFNILFLARIEKRKGIYDAIDTYEILKSRFPAVSLTIAGDGSELPLVRNYVSRNKIDGVQFLGWVDDERKRNAYLDADLYLFPTSWGEGMPNSVLEAMGFGLPVITRPIGGLTDFFEDGKMGYIMESTSGADLASRCEQIMADAEFRIRVSEYNHRYAVDRFLASRVAKRIEGIYQDVLAKNK